MGTRSLTVAVPDAVHKHLRARARKAKRSVEAEVVELLTHAVNGAPTKRAKKKPWTNLADWAEKHDEHWGSPVNSEDVEGFTGRRF
jgi:plasmid stability protein